MRGLYFARVVQSHLNFAAFAQVNRFTNTFYLSGEMMNA